MTRLLALVLGLGSLLVWSAAALGSLSPPLGPLLSDSSPGCPAPNTPIPRPVARQVRHRRIRHWPRCRAACAQTMLSRSTAQRAILVTQRHVSTRAGSYRSYESRKR